ncbi:MAG: NAD(P)H-dependent oxidoreductase [Pseudomonadota bacterium]
MSKTILHIDFSARYNQSLTRELSRYVVDSIGSDCDSITYRDYSQGLSFASEAMVGAFFTPAEDRSIEQQSVLEHSNQRVDEVKSHDVLVIGLPMYNFSAPSSLKAWCDLVARVGETFSYTENGPIGLLEDQRVIIVVASGGTPIGGDFDFLTPWVRHFFNFIGINDISIVAADQLNRDMEHTLEKSRELIRQLAA